MPSDKSKTTQANSYIGDLRDVSIVKVDVVVDILYSSSNVEV